jgi:hypothetical protein
LRREDTVTTNEADRTGERAPEDDGFPPDESAVDESEADETDVDDESQLSAEPEPSPSEGPEMAPARAAEDDTVVEGDPLDTEPPTAEPSAAEPPTTARSAGAPSTAAAERPAGESEPEAALGGPDTAATDLASSRDKPLLADATGYQDRWYEIQTGFVDEPGRAVQSAGELLTEVMDDLTRRLTSELEAVDARQGAGDEVSTEDLRMAFQRYRLFFDRLLTA